LASAAPERARVVFEVIGTEEIRDPNHLAHVLAFYRRAGFRVALDDMGAVMPAEACCPAFGPTS